MNSFFSAIFPHLLLIRGDKKLLLIKRADSAKLFNGYWHCPTGKIECNESPRDAIIRESLEELGIRIKNPKLATVVSIKAPAFEDPSVIWQDLSLFFVQFISYQGNKAQAPVNMEPEKHEMIKWFELNDLPEPLTPSSKKGIEQFIKKIRYGELNTD